MRNKVLTKSDRAFLESERMKAKHGARTVHVPAHDRLLVHFKDPTVRKLNAWARLEAAVFAVCSAADRQGKPLRVDTIRAKAAIDLLEDTFGA